MNRYEVEVFRIAKGSRYNCVLYIPDFPADNQEGVIENKALLGAIGASYGKHFRVEAYDGTTGLVTRWCVKKSAAITTGSGVRYE